MQVYEITDSVGPEPSLFVPVWRSAPVVERSSQSTSTHFHNLLSTARLIFPCVNSTVILPSLNSCISTSPGETGFRWRINEKPGDKWSSVVGGAVHVWWEGIGCDIRATQKMVVLWNVTAGPHAPDTFRLPRSSTPITSRPWSEFCVTICNRTRSPSLTQLPWAFTRPSW